MIALRLPWAFLLRDMRTEFSHKFALVLKVAGAALSVVIFYFIATALRHVGNSSFDVFGGYFPFAVIGLAFITYMTLGVGAMASTMRDSQADGTLELLVVSPTRLSLTLLSSAISGFTFAGFSVFAYLGVGAALGASLGAANVPTALLAFVLTTMSFVPLALFAASIVFLTTRGNPVAFGVRTASVVLSGVFYPTSVLPEWLRIPGQALPLTHALEVLRGSLLLGEGPGALGNQFLALAGLTVVLTPLSLLACRAAVRIARTDGSLTR
jgi:ABC-2 type transport system permease protein